MAQVANYNLSFGTPLVWADRDAMTCGESLAEAADAFLDIFSSQVAVVQTPAAKLAGRAEEVQGKLVKLEPKPTSCMMTILKVIGYITIILPLLALLTRAIFRCSYEFTVEATPSTQSNWEEYFPDLDLNMIAEATEHQGLTANLKAGIRFVKGEIQTAELLGNAICDLPITVVEDVANYFAILANIRMADTFPHLTSQYGNWLILILQRLQEYGQIRKIELLCIEPTKGKLFYTYRITLPQPLIENRVDGSSDGYINTGLT